MKNAFIIILIFLSVEVFPQDKKEISVKTDVTEATVFISGAQILRKKTIELIPGKSVLKFVGLSPFMDPKSVQVRANGEIMVLSVNHQFNYTDSTGKTKELEELTNKLQTVSDKLKVENANLEIVKEEMTFLNDNRIIGGKNQEVSFLNLKETANFYHERVSALKMKELDINKNTATLTKEITAINGEIKQLGSIKIVPSSEIIVKLDSKIQGKCNLELTYFVNNAGWLPSYDIRSKSIDEPIELIYKANIHQNTKEEWKNIKLRLSSSNPNQGNVAPQLKTYFLNYYTAPPKYNTISNQVTGKIFDITTNEPLIGVSIVIKGTTIGTVTDADGNFSLALPSNANEIEVSYIGYESKSLSIDGSVMHVGLNPSTVQLEEVVVIGYGTAKKKDRTGALQGKLAGTAVKSERSMPIPIAQVENQTSVEFEIKTPYTIASDNKNITVDIESYSLSADYKYYCVPKIDKDAFLIADIVDWEKYNLLEGEANIFFENTFVGKSVLDVRNISDTLSLSLGRDKNVIVKREKLKAFTTKQFIGSKKEETRTWQISVKNNKKQPINMILFDQVPVSTLEEIGVSVDNVSGAALDKDKGEVKWEFSLEPSAKKDLELKYRVKYPKEKALNIE